MVQTWKAMGRLGIISTCKTAAAASLIFALLARLPIAGGLLLHAHSDRGIHSHAVTPNDLREGELRTSWRHHHDDDRDDHSNESDGDECVDSLFIFVSEPAIVMGFHFSSGGVIAAVQHPSLSILPRSMLPSDPVEGSRLLNAHRPLAQPLRPAGALDALLQGSHALLL